jgi:chromosome segregation ATPase
LSYEEHEEEGRRAEQESLRARSEQALGEIAQAVIDNPTLHNAITAAFGAREKAIEAQHAAMSALNLPSAGDVERLERRLRSLSQRLEEAEEQVDDANRELGVMRRRLAEQEAKLAEQVEKSEKASSEKKAAKKTKAAAKTGGSDADAEDS